MADAEVLAARFEEHRPRLRAVAHRMLGSSAEADDVVQEAWLRLSRTDEAGTIDNLAAWLTTVVSRICLNALRARATRREDPLEVQEHERGEGPVDPADEAVTSDSLGLALMVVLDRLAPAERLAFVLHDLFTVPFDEIAPIVERTPAATRQLASRARRRVREADPRATEAADRERRREVVEAFLAATQGGDFEALLTVLDPEVVVRSDAAAIAMGSEPEVIGARAVASCTRAVPRPPGSLWSTARPVSCGRMRAPSRWPSPSRSTSRRTRPASPASNSWRTRSGWRRWTWCPCAAAGARPPVVSPRTAPNSI